MDKSKLASFEELIEITEPKLIEVMKRMREIIMEIDAETVETVRLGDRAATYGVGMQKMKDGYLYLIPHKSWVNLGFYEGAFLENKSGLLEGTGKKLRHIKIKNMEMTNNQEIRELMRLAIEFKKKTRK